MKCVILANGEYGSFDAYKKQIDQIDKNDLIFCVDGGADAALAMGIIPDYLIGDMDSVSPDTLRYYSSLGVINKKYPPEKDYCDTHLALNLAAELGAEEVWLWGTLGKRLDHTLANLYSCMDMARQGIKVIHYSPRCCIYIINNRLKLKGAVGDLVSVLALTDKATGVCERGFQYTLADAVIYKEKPIGISNVLASETGEIEVGEGILLVIHYPQTVE
ncbi:MAG: thiamine diphosphokinase [Syntrophomonadaceae bacterium]|jgi:thiamine pyrophosphokinase